MKASAVWSRWRRSTKRVDVLERLPRRTNHIFLPPAVKTDSDALRAAIAHSLASKSRTVLLLDLERAVLIERGAVVGLWNRGIDE